MRVTKQVRDWKEDMELVEAYKHAQTLHNWPYPRKLSWENNLPEPTELILEYWLQQYAIWKAKAYEAEVKAHEAEAREKKLREAIEEALSWTWDCAEGNMLEVISILHSSLYPEEGTPQVKPLNNEDMKASQDFINRAMRED